MTCLFTMRKSISSACQVQALADAFGVKNPHPLQTSNDYSLLFDDNLHVYVEEEERLLVHVYVEERPLGTHAVEQEGVV